MPDASGNIRGTGWTRRAEAGWDRVFGRSQPDLAKLSEEYQQQREALRADPENHQLIEDEHRAYTRLALAFIDTGRV